MPCTVVAFDGLAARSTYVESLDEVVFSPFSFVLQIKYQQLARSSEITKKLIRMQSSTILTLAMISGAVCLAVAVFRLHLDRWPLQLLATNPPDSSSYSRRYGTASHATHRYFACCARIRSPEPPAGEHFHEPESDRLDPNRSRVRCHSGRNGCVCVK